MIETPPDTPAPDIAARNLAERVYAAYARQAAGPFHPQQEQALLARLAEALRPRITEAADDLAAAVNTALDAFEQAEPAIRGPRVAGLDPDAQTVRLAPAD